MIKTRCEKSNDIKTPTGSEIANINKAKDYILFYLIRDIDINTLHMQNAKKIRTYVIRTEFKSRLRFFLYVAFAQFSKKAKIKYSRHAALSNIKRHEARNFIVSMYDTVDTMEVNMKI